MNNKINGLREYKHWLIGTITPENKKEINKRTREIDKEIKRLLKGEKKTMTFKCQAISGIQPPCQPLSFKSKIKKLYKAGKIPIKYDLYGSPMTKKTVTDEHIIPKSKGGTSVLSNIALATKKNNNARGNQDIRRFLSWEQVEKYLAQFDGIKVKDFDLKGYVDNVRRTFQRIWSK